mmetsp:Transcript_22352/g.27400  ORF Transcript_22352/g.27400 Transcript_22352/m.27400 type:complete len:214 (-) Transcript_22352:329-970(-)
MRNTAIISLIFLSCIDAFAFNFKKSAAVSPEIINEALAVYEKKFPPKTETTTPFYNSWGVPKTDIDGTPTSRSNVKSDTPFFSADADKQRATFIELAKVYGADEALQMTKDVPTILSFNKDNFQPSLKEFVTVFGDEEAKGMVLRNPGLLYVRPADAAKSDDLTMQLSYVVAATRPIGPVLLYGTLGLLMLPIIEGIAGVSYRIEFLKSIGVM